METDRVVTDIEHRQTRRENLFLMADLRVDGDAVEHHVKIRNLSARGVMAEGPVDVAPGTPVEIRFDGAEWVPGSVAWMQDTRFGIAFFDEAEPSA